MRSSALGCTITHPYARFSADGGSRVKVTLSGIGCPSHAEQRQMPRHKKNDAVGLKMTVYDSVIYIEQVDARTLALGEEVRRSDSSYPADPCPL